MFEIDKAVLLTSILISFSLSEYVTAFEMRFETARCISFLSAYIVQLSERFITKHFLSGRLSYEDVISLKQIEEMVELFYNSGQFTYTVKFLEKLTGDAFVLYEKLAGYYERKGYLLASSKRIAHYEHLLDFVKELLSEESTRRLLPEEENAAESITELCREYLLFDCYLRENMKTAPSFAKDLSSYKAFLREFYQREEQEREYLPSYTDFDSKQLAKMTHIEFFHYPVWEKEFDSMADILNRKTNVPKPVLFDYWERSKISKDCRFVVLTGVE